MMAGMLADLGSLRVDHEPALMAIQGMQAALYVLNQADIFRPRHVLEIIQAGDVRFRQFTARIVMDKILLCHLRPKRLSPALEFFETLIKT